VYLPQWEADGRVGEEKSVKRHLSVGGGGGWGGGGGVGGGGGGGGGGSTLHSQGCRHRNAFQSTSEQGIAQTLPSWGRGEEREKPM